MRERAEWTDPRRTRVLAARAGDPGDWYESVRKTPAAADDPIVVVFTPRAQGLVCRGCLKAWWPPQLLPMMVFVLLGREFFRAHRFCVPHHPHVEGLLSMLAGDRPQDPREPGCDG